MTPSLPATVAANRFGLGARPGEIARMTGDPRGALRSQLQGQAPILHNASLQDSGAVLSRAAGLRIERQQRRRALSSAQANETGELPESAQKLSAFFRASYLDEGAA